MTDRARPGLVTFYDIWPGNRAGRFLQPRNPHGAHYFCHLITSFQDNLVRWYQNAKSFSVLLMQETWRWQPEPFSDATLLHLALIRSLPPAYRYSVFTGPTCYPTEGVKPMKAIFTAIYGTAMKNTGQQKMYCNLQFNHHNSMLR